MSPWKAPGVWNKPLNITKKNDDSSFPGLKTTGPDVAKTQYEEVQSDELTALEAIYGDDFERLDAGQTAWKVWPRTALLLCEVYTRPQ
jgi:translation initiation factor 2-alpha kinase 4